MKRTNKEYKVGREIQFHSASWLFALMCAASFGMAIILSGCAGTTVQRMLNPDASSKHRKGPGTFSGTVSVSISPSGSTDSSGTSQQFSATVSGTTNTGVVWTASGGTISSGGQFTAPDVNSMTTVTVTATSQADPTKSSSANVSVTPIPTIASSQPLFGTTSSPMNLPISFWNVGVDTAATSDLQSALSLASFSKAYWTIGDDSFATYYASSNDPVYALADSSGNANTCVGGGGAVYNSVHIPAVVTSTWNGLYSTKNDQHFSIVDTTNNQIFAFYSAAGSHLGIYNGQWESDYRACDYLTNPAGDSPVALAVAYRATCTSFPCSSIAGIGAGVAIGGTSASDRNAFMSPYGDIMPQDFDDTGWNGDSVGTFHHALYTIIPSGYISQAVWPTPDEGGTTRSLKNGQIIQLDPYACGSVEFDVSCLNASDRRLAKTLMVYGAVISDYGSYGPKFSGQFSGKDLYGVQHYTNPWTPEGTPGLSSQAQNEIALVTANGTANVIYTPSITGILGKLRVLLPQGPTY